MTTTTTSWLPRSRASISVRACCRNLLTLDNIDSNELLRLLPQSHRDAFLATLRDPDSEQAKELLQTAIEAGEGEDAEAEEPSPALLPWWESDALDEDGETASAPLPDDILDIVAEVTPPPGVGIKSAYNVIALWYVPYLPVLF